MGNLVTIHARHGHLDLLGLVNLREQCRLRAARAQPAAALLQALQQTISG